MTATDTRGRALTERQAALLALMGSLAQSNNTGQLLSRSLLDKFGLDVTPDGVCAVAASLARLGLAERVTGVIRPTYRLTATGQSVRANHHAAQEWCRILREHKLSRS
jgi:hypothetical protein